MLSYEWPYTLPPPHPQLGLIFTNDDHHHHDHYYDHANDYHPFYSLLPHRPIIPDPSSTPHTFPHVNNPFSVHKLPLFQPVQPGIEGLSGYPDDLNRVRLNTGWGSYHNNDLLSQRYYWQSNIMGGELQAYSTLPNCQVEGCNADLSLAKTYHRRHKVCELHSKAAAVLTAGSTQRFCQQCSRFHALSEFDNGKRSCRKRLADHNRRRRKSHQRGHADDHRDQLNSPPDSEAKHQSQVTVGTS